MIIRKGYNCYLIKREYIKFIPRLFFIVETARIGTDTNTWCKISINRIRNV